MESTEAEEQPVLDVNLSGSFTTLKAFMPAMLQTPGHGSVFFTSSVLGARGAHSMKAYRAFQVRLLRLMQSPVQQFAGHGITVYAVAPGPIHTPLRATFAGETLAKLARPVPIGRLGTPSDVAETAVFLRGVGATFIPRQALVIDGGSNGRAYWHDTQHPASAAT